MGGGESKPAPPPTVIEEEPPAGSGQSSTVYPDRPDTPRLDGVSRALANECNGCNLQVISGVSSSSVKISREFGFVATNKCLRYKRELKNVRDKKMSFQDFLTNLQNGEYLRELDNGYCEQVKLSDDDEIKTTKIDEFDEGKLQSVRIQQMSSGGFSADTKVKITPSIPFRMRFSAANQGVTEISIKSMTLFHPCPLRLEGVQPDALLSLNDPSFDNPNYVILVPLVARNGIKPSIRFLEKVMSQVGAVSEADPATGAYLPRDIPTGADWTLSKLFSVQPSGDGNFDVMDGFYEWEGMPALERVKEEGNGTITYSWKKSGTPAPRYIMIDTPVECAPVDLAILTQRMPVTPAADAVHAVLYSSDPFRRGIVHKPGPPGANCSTKETFTNADLQGAYSMGEENLQGFSSYMTSGTQEEEACDAWTLWARASAGKGFTTQQVLTMIYSFTAFVAMCVGTYLAFNAILRLYDVEYSELAKNIGKLAAVFAKNLQQKAAALQTKLAVGMPMGPAGLKALAAGDVSKLAGTPDLAKLGNQAHLAKLAGTPDLAKLGNEADLAKLANVSSPAGPLALALAEPAAPAPAPAPTEKACPVGTAKDGRGTCLPTPEGQGKALGLNRPASLTGSRRTKPGRDRAGSTRRDPR